MLQNSCLLGDQPRPWGLTPTISRGRRAPLIAPPTIALPAPAGSLMRLLDGGIRDQLLKFVHEASQFIEHATSNPHFLEGFDKFSVVPQLLVLTG